MTPKDLIISEFQKGTADSPLLGFAELKNIDNWSTPGIAKINFKTKKKSGTTITGLVTSIVRDQGFANNLYARDDGGVIYNSTDAGETWSVLSGNTTPDSQDTNLVIWKDYLFSFRASAIDVYGPLSNSPAWTNSWQTYNTSGRKVGYVGQDDILYIGTGRYVASVQEKVGQTFAPGTSATYSYTAQALDLPQDYVITSIAELGDKLMLGTHKGVLSYINKVADIFPWDRSSVSFNIPIQINDFGVLQLKTKGNILYAVTGIRGNIYACNGTFVKKIRDFYRPMQYTSSQQDTWGQVDTLNRSQAVMQLNEKLYIGVSNKSNAFVGRTGVWSIDDSQRLAFEHEISTGNSASSAAVIIGALCPLDDDSYLIGWKDSNTSTQGIDKVVSSERYTSYTAHIDSPLYEVGTDYTPLSFTQCEVVLAKPLSTGQGVKVSYRTDLTASWTVVGTFDFATDGAKTRKTLNKSINSVDQLQIRIELTTGSASVTTPFLKEVRLR